MFRYLILRLWLLAITLVGVSLLIFVILRAVRPADVQASMFIAAACCVANMLADLTYALLDPRIRYS